MSRIELDDVHKAFGPKRVLAGVNLAVAEGESLVIIGGSGTGKSVTLKCVLGLLRPDRGRVRVDGADVAALRGAALARHRARFGMLFQGGALFDSLPVWRNVAFALSHGHSGGAARLRRVAEENLARVGLGPEVMDLRPAELSGGMQKRVALARAVAARPQIVFFDEPTTGLDPIMADVINDLIVDLVKGLGVTAVTITHDLSSARKIADRVAMLHGGRIIWEGPKDRLYSSGNPYVQQFVEGRAEGPIRMQVRAAALAADADR